MENHIHPLTQKIMVSFSPKELEKFIGQLDEILTAYKKLPPENLESHKELNEFASSLATFCFQYEARIKRIAKYATPSCCA
jgi:Asp-tRNA(Asn)/Glu-tRNA(Gln) amidotransferase C subunit